ncbi:hypothetical protein MKW98_008508 [Papaver atlanticum]|uniref:Wall-associated receptor kinase galacturonan-binding domain-containing protein n=1 Tax=Papaver atlanticum TaxID=357466 RepID=A0AAD4TCS6_9MAGN|nr:hypothetical protein MKW98_008508 [Papaver atlanticum]
MQIIFFWFLLLAILSSYHLVESSTFLQAKPGCQTKCGNISIPYPFGIGDDCFINPSVVGGHSGYDINCNTSYDPPKPFIRKGSLEILSISETEIRIRNDRIASLCYDESGSPVPGATFRDLNLVGSVFTISYTKNSFYGIGCEIIARIEWGSSGGRQPITSTNSSCEPKCKSRENLMEGSCTGTNGCCQTTFPKNLQNVSVEVLGRLPANGLISSLNSCNFAYLAEQGQYPSQESELLPDGGLHAELRSLETSTQTIQLSREDSIMNMQFALERDLYSVPFMSYHSSISTSDDSAHNSLQQSVALGRGNPR